MAVFFSQPFLTLIARPIAIFALLTPFRSSKEQMTLVSLAGLRGAASIVFAIQAVLSGIDMKYNLFNVVFCIVLLSILIQGTLLAPSAHKLQMIDAKADVRKTFNDYQSDGDITFFKISLDVTHKWVGLSLKELQLPAELLVVLVLRNGTSFIPNGTTILQEHDLLVIAGQGFEDHENMTLYEISIDSVHKWKEKSLQELSLPAGVLVVLIRNKEGSTIPSGTTVIRENDTLVMAKY